MKEALKKHTVSFKNAFAGLSWAVKTQPNFRVHLFLSLAAIILGVYLGIDQSDWAIIVFTIVLGLSGGAYQYRH